MMAVLGGTIRTGKKSPKRKSSTITSRTTSEDAANRGYLSGSSFKSAVRAHWVRQILLMTQGSSGTITSRDNRPPRLTRLRYSVKVMPMELPTRKVAGSPTRISKPAELLTIAINTSGGIISTFNAPTTQIRMRAHNNNLSALGQKGARHNQQDHAQKKTFAAAVGCPQKYITDVIEQAGRHQRSCHHHAAKQESQRSAEYSNDVQNILQAEHPNRGEGADTKQRG